MSGATINPGLQFINTAGVPGLVSGIQTGMIQPAQTLTAFQAVGSAIDTYASAFPQDTTLMGLRGNISGLPANPPITAQAQEQILGQLTQHKDDVELAVRMAVKIGNVGQVAVTGGAALINTEAPYDLGAEWRWIPAGTFQFGSADDDQYAYDAEKPLRQVIVGGFFMLDHPVTNREWIAFLEATGERDERDISKKFSGLDQPAVLINHPEASRYAEWLGSQVSAQVEQSVIGRLPTEQEWERAAKGPDGNEFITPATSRQAHFDSDRTRAVTDPEAYVNGFGLKDMIGNVWEWTSSPWAEGSSAFVLRGASWDDYSPQSLRAAFRNFNIPDDRFSFIGFRPVLVPQDPKKS